MSMLHDAIKTAATLKKVSTLIKDAARATRNASADKTPHCVLYEDIWPLFYKKKHSSRRKLGQLQDGVHSFVNHVKATKVATARSVCHVYYLTFVGLELFLKSIDSERAQQVLAICKEQHTIPQAPKPAPMPAPAEVQVQTARTHNSMASFLEKGKREALAVKRKAVENDAARALKAQKPKVNNGTYSKYDVVQQGLELAEQMFHTVAEQQEFKKRLYQQTYC